MELVRFFLSAGGEQNTDKCSDRFLAKSKKELFGLEYLSATQTRPPFAGGFVLTFRNKFNDRGEPFIKLETRIQISILFNRNYI